MAEYAVEFEVPAQKALKKMDKSQANIILAWVKKNLVGTDNPRRHGKALATNHAGKWRYRVGDYRLIANISDEKITILILEIGHRSQVYELR
jgi:mRNA interferase RelE/StbE